jgi:hypothetical protein
MKLLSIKKGIFFSGTLYHMGEQSGSCQISWSFIMAREFTLSWHKGIFNFFIKLCL